MPSSSFAASTSVDVAGTDCCNSYVPKPLITFLFDQPSKLVCQLCKETELRLGSRKHEIRDSIPAILPCGHVAGLECLLQWMGIQSEMSGRRSCPFCRMPLEYACCDHQLEPKPINKTSIFHLPKTIPEGGKIPDNCMDCRPITANASNMDLVEALKSGYIRAKANHERTKSDKDKAILDNQALFLENTFKALSRKYVEDMLEW